MMGFTGDIRHWFNTLKKSSTRPSPSTTSWDVGLWGEAKRFHVSSSHHITLRFGVWFDHFVLNGLKKYLSSQEYRWPTNWISCFLFPSRLSVLFFLRLLALPARSRALGKTSWNSGSSMTLIAVGWRDGPDAIPWLGRLKKLLKQW